MRLDKKKGAHCYTSETKGRRYARLKRLLHAGSAQTV